MKEKTTRLRLLELIAQQTSLQVIFSCLTSLLEEQFPEFFSALYDLRAGQLTLAHAPSLPTSFTEGLQTLGLDESMTTVGACAVKGEAVITRVIRGDAHWESHAFIAEQHAIKSCWAHPVASEGDKPCGVLALFGKVTRKPRPHEQRMFAEAAQLTALAMAQSRLLARLKQQECYDALTGLPNRNMMLEKLEQAASVANSKSESVALIVLDIDNFKTMNHRYGASLADSLLKAVGERLKTCLYARDTVARLGEDEFGLVVPTSKSDDNVIVTEKILAAMNAPFRVGEHTLNISTSLGVGVYPRDGKSCEQLLQAAGRALTIAKTEGKQQYRFFRPYMTERLGDELDLSRELKCALETQAFVLYYQPRVNAQTRQIDSAEALLRWQHPQRGLLMPDTFLKAAERGHLMTEVDTWVVREVCRHLKLTKPLSRPGRLAFNLSPASFQDRDFVAKLIDLVQREKLSPECLEIEITENVVFKDPERSATQLNRLKVALPGLRGVVDNFGTGYSSLAFLRYLPVDALKIDRMFVRDVASKDAKQRLTALAVIRSLVLLGHELQLRVVAEGVETAEQGRALTELRCDELQGFFYSKPLPLAELQKLTLPNLPVSNKTMKN